MVLEINKPTSTPQLPFREPQIPSNRDHKALNRGTLLGLGGSLALPTCMGSLGSSGPFPENIKNKVRDSHVLVSLNCCSQNWGAFIKEPVLHGPSHNVVVAVLQPLRSNSHVRMAGQPFTFFGADYPPATLICPAAASTQCLRSLFPKPMKGMVCGTRKHKYWVLGPSGLPFSNDST